MYFIFTFYYSILYAAFLTGLQNKANLHFKGLTEEEGVSSSIG